MVKPRGQGVDGLGLEDVLQDLQIGDANQEFFSKPENIQLKTHMTRGQIMVFAKAMRFAKDWDIPELHDFVLDIMLNSVSLERLSRKEWDHIMSAKQARTHVYEEAKKP